MSQKTISSRIQLKNDSEANWSNASSFKPKRGEAIVYNSDSEHTYPRIKVGDGNATVANLPFINDVEINDTLGTGTQLGVISINGVDTTIYAPRTPSITAQVDQNETLIINETELETDAPVSVQITPSDVTPTAEFIVSTNTASGAELTGVLSSTDPLVNGKIIYYMTNYALPSTNITIKLKYGTSNNYTSSIPVYRYGDVRSNTPYPANYIIALIYYNSKFYVIDSTSIKTW